MNSTRLAQLLKFLEEDPDDPFTLYALALEYKAISAEETRKLFNQLLNKHPDYLPTYYQAAQYLEEMGEANQALDIYQKGIELAHQQNNLQAQKELQAAYALLMEENN